MNEMIVDQIHFAQGRKPTIKVFRLPAYGRYHTRHLIRENPSQAEHQLRRQFFPVGRMERLPDGVAEYLLEHSKLLYPF